MLTPVGLYGGRWVKTSGSFSTSLAVVTWDSTAVETPNGCSMSAGVLTLTQGGIWVITASLASVSGQRLDAVVGVSTSVYYAGDSCPATASLVGYVNISLCKAFSPNTNIGLYAKSGTAAAPGDVVGEVNSLTARWLGGG
jgi:hypothetical protein